SAHLVAIYIMASFLSFPDLSPSKYSVIICMSSVQPIPINRAGRLIAENKGNHKVYQIGNPVAKVAFSSSIQKDQRTLIPWSVAFLILLLLLSLRSYSAAFLPLLTGGLSIFATLGFMTLMGYQMNVITALIMSFSRHMEEL
ncbi:MAG: MMPL family transporter, partial [Nitrospiraceae bacterium]|nr:MMPL family transporter [Nitrospiraceae bacterium]